MTEVKDFDQAFKAYALKLMDREFARMAAFRERWDLPPLCSAEQAPQRKRLRKRKRK